MALAALLAAAEGLLRPIQKQALIDLYESMNGASWALWPDHPLWNRTAPELHPFLGGNYGWDVESPWSDPCLLNGSVFGKSWYGVGCQDPCDPALDGPLCAHGQVVSLELGWNNVSGVFPHSMMNILKKLSLLDLSHNSLSGTIPTEVGKLRVLNYFQLGDNALSGTIPTEVRTIGSHMPRDGDEYASEDVDCNATEADAHPTMIRQSVNVACKYVGPRLIGPTVFDVGHNQLNGTLPTTMGELINLKTVDISHNSALGGECCTEESSWYDRSFYDYPTAIPTEIGQLWKLQALRMHNSNHLRYLPTQLGSLRDLVWLEASGNGSIPNSNQISGTIPSQIGRLKNILRVVAQDNQISGSIPLQIRGMSALMHVELQGNKLSGSIPDSYGGTTRLRYWDSFDNKLVGDLPPSVFELKELTELYIQNEHSDAIRNYYCRERIEQSAHGKRHNYAELGSVHFYYKNPHHTMCVNPLDVEGAFGELSGDV